MLIGLCDAGPPGVWSEDYDGCALRNGCVDNFRFAVDVIHSH